MAQGLWMGIICGLGIQVTALVTMNLFTNWDECVGISQRLGFPSKFA